jgi:multidrug resistance efflux pump
MTVELSDLINDWTFTGIVTPVKRHNIYLDVPNAILVDHNIGSGAGLRSNDASARNFQVEEGDIIAVFSSETVETQEAPLRRAVEVARINYNVALATWESSNLGYTELQSRTERDIRNAEEAYANAQIRHALSDSHATALEQARIRHQHGDISASALRQAETDYEAAVRQSEQGLRQAQTDYENTIWQLEQNLRTARIGAENDAAVRRERLNLTAAEENLAAHLEAVENLIVRSPVDGVVTYFTDLFVGETYNSNRLLFTISDVSTLYITARMPNFLASQFQFDDIFSPGEEVELTAQNLREQIEFSGTIVSLDLDQRRDAAINEDVVVVSVDEWPEGVDFSIGSIQVRSRNWGRVYDSIVIPLSLLRTAGTYEFVHVLQDGVSVERTVLSGQRSRTEVVILEGLSVGEELIVR